MLITKSKIGILSLSTVTGAASAITTIIPLLLVNYPDKSIANIESLITVSSLSALVTIIFNGIVTKRIGLKNTIVTGLLLGMIFGISPFFIENYYLFLITRILLGLSIGLYSPHAISLISLAYTGQERTILLGIQMGISALGNAILLLLSGFFASITWQFTFLVYLFLGLIAILVYKYVPNIETEKRESKDEKIKMSNVVKSNLALCFITFLIIWGVQLKIPSLLVQKGIDSSGFSGLILSNMNIAGMFAGFTFGYFFRIFNVWLLPIGFLGASLSIGGMIMAEQRLSIFIFAVLFNFIYSFTGPIIILKINQNSLEQQLTKVNSLVSMMTILSSYGAPFIWNTLTSTLTHDNYASTSMLIILVCTLIIGFFFFLFYYCKGFNYKKS